MMGALSIGIASFTAGCSDKTMFQEVEDSEVSVGKGFMLHATNGSDTDTRLAFGEDGLTLKWEDGDQLYMVNQEGGEPIPLTTSLSEPSSSAVFYSESAIPAGTYYVMYNNQSLNFEEPMVFEEPVDVISQLKMYSKDPLVIEEGAKEASVTLQHAQAMITFNLTNMPTDNTLWYVGMATSDGWVSKAKLADNTLTPLEKDLVIGTRISIYGSSLSDSYRFTVLPKNLEGKKITFFAVSQDGSSLNLKFYELEKDGKNLQAGYNYNINLDGNQVTPSDIQYDSSNRKHKITSINDFKQLACLSHLRWITAFLVSDLSFSGESDFLPLDEASLDGCGHTVSGVSFDGEGMDNVGLVRSGEVSNLTMDNVSIKGRNNVGAFVGYVRNGKIENCTLQGEGNSIVGVENVGGISGLGGSFSDCKVEAAIQGNVSVGGICGSDGGSFNRCFTKGSVSGDVSVGGISGWSAGSFVECGSSATVTGTDANIGGICGCGDRTFEKCYSEGTVSGKTSVGGICGLTQYNSFFSAVHKFSLCYTTGNVSATESKAGGILGYSKGVVTEVLACYSLGDITAPSEAAGIVGFLDRIKATTVGSSSITYCYSVGEVGENGSGIVNAFTNLTAEYLSNCATWASTLSPGRTDEGFVNCTNNAENNTIRKALSQCPDFNKYYSVYDWDGGTTQKLNDCPLLLWQVDGINVGTGEDPLPVPPYQDGGNF